MSVHLFGIRHHGPGSAASLLQALDRLQPDAVLLEGPPDADAVAQLALHVDMKPPVALLIYPSEGDQQAAYYPFASFSPEWNGLRWALLHQVPVRFMDLPQTHQMALEMERVTSVDGWDQMAQAAGYTDGELWWEKLVEKQSSAEIFAGINEAMTTLREGQPTPQREALREAWMRRTIRQTQKEGRQRIAVVCGAWHVGALEPNNWPKASQDEQLLKGLPKRKVEAAWVPWTYDRLSFATGYGAGVESPEYYHLLWETGASAQVAVQWMVAATRLLRAEDLAASAASAVEAVRLAQTLAALRGHALAGLAELQEAALSVLCLGASVAMKLIHRKLVLGERLGEVPAEAPQVPLARDVAAQQKRLRLPAQAAHRDLDLDLRNPNDRERSFLLHRLRLLEIPWGELLEARGTGTFRESWRVQWQPEFAMNLVQAAQWGNTVSDAAGSFVGRQAQDCPQLAGLTELTEKVLLADLPLALQGVLDQLQARAALASDPAHLVEALPPFARILRYPDVRQTDSQMLVQVVGGVVQRIAVGLPLACSSLDDDAAEALFKVLAPAHQALVILARQEWLDAWRSTLQTLADMEVLHGLLAGRAVWLLLDLGHFAQAEASRRLGLALSRSVAAEQAAAWVEGFLRDNGELLVHAPELYAVLDSWIEQLPDERFQEVLPLLRRTFSTFPIGVRRSLGSSLQGQPREEASELVEERAALVLPLLRQILGLSS